MVHTVVATLLLLFFQNAKGSVDGTVLSSTTNKPIAGAQITAVRSQTAARSNPAATLSVSADDNGYFVLRDLEPGTYVLNASADGYARQQAGASAYGKTQIMAPATVTAGQTTHDLVFRLMPAGTVSGR